MTSTQRYLEMADVLEAELLHVPVGAQVPSEHVLADRFRVSRPAARAALQELERRLLVRRVQGVGTFRRGRVEYVVSASVPPSFSDTVRMAGAEPGSRLLSCGVRRAVEQERARLCLPTGAAVWSVERVFSVNGEVAAYATSVLPRKPLLNLDRELGDEVSLHRVLRRRYGLTVTRSRYRISLDVPPPGIADHLTGGNRSALWLAESVNRTAGGPPVEYARTYLRPDVLDVAFEIAEDPS
ncbi:GntR family transcriptional regulator [Nonomuraea sediminis]|uniref:GntR family transcriptional regulator n=1 Tax=Nonomuraea sediminis TaxID=2835864 RepID=UPI001BDC489C|nr:GntR family transcriptional regulator [Nonomuraea sediminis]